MDIYQIRELYNQLHSGNISLDSMDEEELEQLYLFIKEEDTFSRYNQLAYFNPYSYQRKFFRAGSEYDYRMLCAGNQMGKSYGASFEYAMHLTGIYPDWWEGDRFDSGDKLFWVLGVTLDSTVNVLQTLLLGTSDIRRTEEIGTGSIPRDHIDIDGMIKDGRRCVEVRIKHIEDRDTEFSNILRFYASSVSESTLMGQTLTGMIWADEQFPDSERLHAQFVARTAAGGGRIMYTLTPEKPELLELYEMFKENKDGKLYWQQATWWDCDHFSEERIESMLAALPAWLRDLKSKGIPASGTGSIFPFSDNELIQTCLWSDVKPTWKLLAGVDFGYSGIRDDSTIVFTAYDIEEDRIFVIDAWFSSNSHDDCPLSHMPEYMASIIKACPYPNIPVICPNDASGIISGTTKTRAQVLIENGCNVLYENYYIPYQLTGEDKKSTSKVGGLNYMVEWMSKGLLKLSPNTISSGMNELWKELRGYVWKDNKGSGKIEPIDKNDHGLDAMRYATTSIKYRGYMAAQCIADSISDAHDYNTVISNRWNSAYS